MSANNSIRLIGNLGDDPKVHTTQDGREFVTFSLATNFYWKDKVTGEKRSRTEWHNCVQYGPRAQVIKNYVKKGSALAIEGELRYNTFTKNDVTIKSAVVVVNDFQFVGANNSQSYGDETHNKAPASNTGAAANLQAPQAAAATVSSVDTDVVKALGEDDFIDSAMLDLDIPF